MTRRYQTYCDSGCEWLGDLPSHWRTTPLSRLASYRTSSVDKKSKAGEIPVRLCNYTDVYYSERIRAADGEYMTATATGHEVERFGLRPGDVIITKDSEDWRDIGVPAMVEDSFDDFVCGYHLGIVRSGEEIDSGYLFCALLSDGVNKQLQVAATGVTRYGIPNASVESAVLPLPPLGEQRAIAAHLDRKTARIDRLITLQGLLIERLDEYRTALVTRVVTKGLPPEAAEAAGLDPEPALKDSGVEWLGEVPEHWEVGQLRRTFSVANGGTPATSDEDNWDGAIVWLTPDDLGRNDGKAISGGRRNITPGGLRSSGARLSPSGSIVLSTRAPIGHLVVTDLPAATNQGCRTLVPATETVSGFAYYSLIASRVVLQAAGKGSTFMELSAADLAQHRLPQPPPDEQQTISNYLDTQSQSIDTLRTKAEVAIERLVEYRSALVSAAVTGKIDVRDVTASDAGGG